MFDSERGLVIDVEATFVRVEAPGKHVREAAQRLVEEVLRQRKDWVTAWRDVIINPKGPSIENFPPETPGCSPGSCQMKVGNRIVAKFIVRFCDESCAVEVEADMPARKLAGWGVGMERQAVR
jgi:hypothetical protein